MAHPIKQFITSGIGSDVIHEYGIANLSGRLDLPAQQDRSAAHKHHRTGAQFKPPLPQSAQQVVHKFFRLSADQVTKAGRRAGTAIHQDGVDLRFVQQNVLLGADSGAGLVVKQDHPILQGIADGQVSFSVFDLKVIGRKPADIHDQGSGSILQGADDCRRCCIGLRVAADIVDQNGIGLVLVGEIGHAASQKILAEFQMLGAIVRRRQPNRQLNPKGIPAIDILDVQFLRNGKQGKDKEALV